LAEANPLRVVPPPEQPTPPEEEEPSTRSNWGRVVLPGGRIARWCAYCHWEGHLDEDCPAPHTSYIVTGCIVNQHHQNYLAHQSRCAQFNDELLRALLSQSEELPARPPTLVQQEREEVAPRQESAPPHYARPPCGASSPEEPRGGNRRARRRGRGRGAQGAQQDPQLNANLQQALTPGVQSRDGYLRTWPHINFVARENNIPIYRAREQFAEYDVASLYESWRTPIPPAPQMPDPREDRS
jgi:hypothetical protein